MTTPAWPTFRLASVLMVLLPEESTDTPQSGLRPQSPTANPCCERAEMQTGTDGASAPQMALLLTKWQ